MFYELTHDILSAAIEVHKNTGPGLLESVYGICLGIELENRGLHFQKEISIPIKYKEKKIDQNFRMDFLVENEIILEIKSIDKILPLHESQLLTYLHLAEKSVGLLINFNVPILKNGIRPFILNKHTRAAF